MEKRICDLILFGKCYHFKRFLKNKTLPKCENPEDCKFKTEDKHYKLDDFIDQENVLICVV